MKHCNGNYLMWGVREDYPEKDGAKLIPNPFCTWCEYMQACAFRVEYWLEYWKDMPDEDVDVIKHVVGNSKIVPDNHSNTSTKMN